MKIYKRIACLLLALALFVGTGAMVFANDFGIELMDADTAKTAGSITIQSTQNEDAATPNVSVANKTFNAWLILELTIQGEGDSQGFAYHVPTELRDFYIEYFKVSEEDQKTLDSFVYNRIAAMSDHSVELNTFAKKALEAAKKVTAEEGGETVYPLLKGTVSESGGDAATISGLPLGYYIVEDATKLSEDGATPPTEDPVPISALMLTTTKPEVTITIKATKPDITKKINGDADTDESTTGDVEKNNVAIGDEVPYKLISQVPDTRGYDTYYYMVEDHLSSGLTFLDDTLEVYITKTDGKDQKLELETYTEAEDGTYYKLKTGEYTEVKPTEETTADYESIDTKYTRAGDYTLTVVEEDEGTAFYINFVDFAGLTRDKGEVKYTENPNGEYYLYVENNSKRYTDVKPDDNTNVYYQKDANGNYVKYAADISGVTPAVAKTGDTILITYKAKLNENAVIGVEGNPNAVKLHYSTDPSDSSKKGVTIEKTVYSYTTGLDLYKVDNQDHRLTGAKFTLTGTKLNTTVVAEPSFVKADNPALPYYQLKDGSFTTEIWKNATDQENYANTDTWEKHHVITVVENGTKTVYTYTAVTEITDGESPYYLQDSGLFTTVPIEDAPMYQRTTSASSTEPAEQFICEATVGTDGFLRIDGLSAGDYVLTEIEAPDGYRKLEQPINIKITWDPVKDSTIDPTQCAWNFEITGTGSISENQEGDRIELNILNETGEALPETGGIGTTVFYAVGSVLTLAAVVLLVTKKKAGSAE